MKRDPWANKAARIEAEKANHDRYVRELSDETLIAASKDFRGRIYHDQKDPEHRWGMARKAALLREAERRSKLQTA